MPRPRPDDLVLAAMPARNGITKRGLERKLGLTRQTVWRVVKRLHDQGRCHIAGWHALKGGGPFQPRYVGSPGVDVPCTLQPLPAVETQRRFREKARANGNWAKRCEKIRMVYRRMKSVKDPATRWYAALKM